MLKAIAHPNELTKDVSNDFVLQVESRGTLYAENIVERMKKKKTPTENVDGLVFVVAFFAECVEAAKEGYHVVLPGLCRIYVGIHGVVHLQDLGHNVPADRLNIHLVMIQSPEVRKALQDIPVHVNEQVAPTGPVIQGVCNPVKREVDTLDTGAMVLIQGMRIAVRGDKTDEIGVFFTSLEDGSVVRVAPDMMSPNMPSKLQFVLPAAVVPGEWKVAVTTQGVSDSARHTVNVRSYEYPNIVTVV